MRRVVTLTEVVQAEFRACYDKKSIRFSWRSASCSHYYFVLCLKFRAVKVRAFLISN